MFMVSALVLYQEVFALFAFAGALVADDASFAVIARPPMLLKVGHQLCRIDPEQNTWVMILEGA